jgi:hypothetical protein
MPVFGTVVDYINALAWPVVVFIVIVVFHGPISKILDRISQASQGSINIAGQVISWDGAIAQAAAGVEQVNKALPPPTRAVAQERTPADDRWDGITALVPTNPTAAILMAWMQVELALQDRAESFDVSSTGSIAGGRLMKVAQLPKDLFQSLGVLSNLRNAVAHGERNPDAAQAQSFVTVAKDLADAVERAPAPVPEPVPQP